MESLTVEFPGRPVPLGGKAARGSLALVSRQIVSIPANALGLICLSHFLLPRDFGIQTVMALLISCLSIVVDAGTSQALVQSLHGPDVDTLKNVQVYKFSAALICGLLVISLSPWIIRFYKLSGVIDTRFTCVCVVLAWLQSVRGHLAIPLQRDIRWPTLSRIEIGEIVAQNIASIGVAATFRSVWAFPAGLVCRYLFGIALLIRHHNTVTPPGAASGVKQRRSLRSIMGFGVPLQIMTGLSIAQNSINPLVVGTIAGIAAAGYIGWGFSVAALPTLAFQSLPALLFTVTAEGRRRNTYDSELLVGGLRSALTGACAATIGFSAILPILTTHLFGGQWHDALLPAKILLIGSLCMWINGLVTSQFYAFGVTGIRMRFALIEFAVLWLTAGVGGWIGGASGYAVGFSSAELLLLVGLIRLAGKSTGIFFDQNYTISIILMTCALVCFEHFVFGRSTQGQSVVGSSLGLVIGLTMFAAGLYAVGRRTLLSDLSRLRVAFSLR